MMNSTGYQHPKIQGIRVKLPEKNLGKKTSLFSQLNRICHYLLTVETLGQEPRIWQSKDRFGQTWWHAYDPITKRFVCRDSEDEIRIWLEERYYRSIKGSNPIRYAVKETAITLFF
jgi:hypothetical protein